MRFLKGAVAVSLGLNLCLAVAYYLGYPRASRNLATVDRAVPLSIREQIVLKVMTNTVAAPAKILDWHAVESEDYRKYIANLRLTGCPEKTIRDVIVADVNELFRQRYREQFPPTNRVEYWKPGNPLGDLMDETKLSRQHELQQDKRSLIRALLGTDYTDEQDLSAIQMDSYQERLLNFLPPEKRSAMKELEDKFTVKKMKTLKTSFRGNEEASNALQAEKDAAVLKILSPEEKFEYDLRRSETATFLRVGLGTFELQEEEFRAIFPAIKEFINQAGKPGFGAVMRGEPDPRPEGAAGRAVLRQKLQAALGNPRFLQLIEQTRWNVVSDEPQPDGPETPQPDAKP